jgi:hypothetical protein
MIFFAVEATFAVVMGLAALASFVLVLRLCRRNNVQIHE